MHTDNIVSHSADAMAPFDSPDTNDENGHKYVGLVNQAMTCYLNSLLQSLYMIPEFRNVIYKISRKQSPRDIQFQLQRLFAQLQTSEKQSIQTVDLTSSFGWENEGLYQHDVQELFRLMIEALEKKWAHTPHKGSIENLWKGDIIDYVKCLRCKTIKRKDDMYLDLSLAVKSDGAQHPHKSIHEAMTAFVTPERLDGNNKYRCDTCDSLEDAEKGLGLKTFPYLLAIQLKRFNFDYNTFLRVKLNDRLTFPDYLDLNKFVYKEPAPPKPKMSYAAAAASTPSEAPASTPTKQEEPRAEDDWYNEAPSAEPIQELLRQGPYIYELFSVMVHQGSASGGHYYAYIKNMEQQRWFCFNDSSVTSATVEDVQRTFGGNLAFTTNNTNAYMLMYRRVEATRNETFVRTAQLPTHMTELLTEMIEKNRQQIAREEYEKSLVNVQIVCNDRAHISDAQIEISLPKHTPYAELHERLCLSFARLDPDTVRLVICNSSWSMKRVCDSSCDAELPLVDALKESSHYGSHSRPEAYIMVDTREGKHFNEFPPVKAVRTADVFLVRFEHAERMPLTIASKRVPFDASGTVGDLKQSLTAIESVRECGPLQTRIVHDRTLPHTTSHIRLWDNPDAPIKELLSGYHRDNIVVHVDVGKLDLVEEDRARVPFVATRMFKAIDHRQHVLSVRVLLPPETDYFRVALAPPQSRSGMRSPTPSPFVQLQNGPMPIIVDDEENDAAIADGDARPSSVNEDDADSLHANSFSGKGSMEVSDNECGAPSQPEGAPTISPAANSTIPLVLQMQQVHSCDQNMSAGTKQYMPDFTESLPVGILNEFLAYAPRSQVAELLRRTKRRGEEEGFNIENLTKNNANIKELMSCLDADNSMLCGTSSEDKENIDFEGAATSKRDAIDVDDENIGEGDDENANDCVPSSSNYTISVLERDTAVNMIVIEADKRQHVVDFHRQIAAQLEIKETNFRLCKHYRLEGDGHTINPGMSDKLDHVYDGIDHLSIKLQVTAREDEHVVYVHMYHPAEPDVSKWPVLFHLAIPVECTAEALLLKCQALLKSIYSEEYSLDNLYLREVNTNGAPVLDANATLPIESRQKIVYLQVATEAVLKPATLEASRQERLPLCALMGARFCPSTLEVLPPFEVFVASGTETPPQSAAILAALAEKSGIPRERLLVSSPLPETSWNDSRYPYHRSTLDLIDKRVSFDRALMHYCNYNGYFVYCVDADEKAKEPSDDERRYIRNREQRQAHMSNGNAFRRVERPLRIQVASESEP